ncbi:MAG: hypothetical protein M3Q09_11130 [Gemmatimonadota bacterium]|nr:hypothetical protein [Gemmatimonadota bacterium]
MTPITMAKMALALSAAVLFGLGVRSDMPALRWAAIGLLAFAVLLRFIDRSRREP